MENYKEVTKKMSELYDQIDHKEVGLDEVKARVRVVTAMIKANDGKVKASFLAKDDVPDFYKD